MAVRYKGRCRFCPDHPPAQPLKATLKPKPDTSKAALSITTPGEGQRLWKHVLFGTSTCISMIEGYADLGMPGDPRNALIEMRDRLNQVISNIEATHANNHRLAPDERHPRLDRASSDHSGGRGVHDLLQDSQDSGD
jgi:hypothetical protein